MFVPVLVLLCLGLSEAAATGADPAITQPLPPLTPATTTRSPRVTTIELPTTDPTTHRLFGHQRVGHSMSERAPLTEDGQGECG